MLNKRGIGIIVATLLLAACDGEPEAQCKAAADRMRRIQENGDSACGLWTEDDELRMGCALSDMITFTKSCAEGNCDALKPEDFAKTLVNVDATMDQLIDCLDPPK